MIAHVATGQPRSHMQWASVRDGRLTGFNYVSSITTIETKEKQMESLRRTRYSLIVLGIVTRLLDFLANGIHVRYM